MNEIKKHVRDHEPGIECPDRARRRPGLQRPRLPFKECADTIPAVPCGAAYLSRDRGPRAKDRLDEPVASGFLHLLLSSRQLRRRDQRGLYQTDPGINTDFDYPALIHNSYGRLFLDRPNRFRFDGYYVTPFRLSVGPPGLRQLGGAPEPARLLQQVLRRGDSARPQGLCREAPDGVGGEPHAGLSHLHRPGRRDGSGVRLQPLQQSDRDRNGRGLDHRSAQRLSRARSTTRTSKPPGPQYGLVTSRQEPRSLRAAVKVTFSSGREKSRFDRPRGAVTVTILLLSAPASRASPGARPSPSSPCRIPKAFRATSHRARTAASGSARALGTKSAGSPRPAP